MLRGRFLSINAALCLESFNQSILKEISLGISLEGMMLKLKLQYFGHLMWRVDSLEMTDARRDWGQEEKGMTEDEMAGWHHGLDGRWVWVNSRRWWWTGRPGVLRFMGSQTVRHDWATELNWTYILLISIWRNRKWPLVLKPLLQKLIIYRNRVWYWTFSLTVSFGNMYQMYQSFSL